MFDVNFISPMKNREKYEILEPEIEIDGTTTQIKAYYEAGKPKVTYETSIYGEDTPHTHTVEENVDRDDIDCTQCIRNKKETITYIRELQEKYGFYNETTTKKVENTNMKFTDKSQEYSYWSVEEDEDNVFTKYIVYVTHEVINSENSEVTQKYEVKMTKIVYEEKATLESVARIMRGTISTWYNVMREIALVGLLCVLVYVAIRGIISSSTEDKAKYKKMLFDWFTALVIIFTLHYIISFTLAITESVVDVFNVKILDEDGSDIVFSKLRSDIGNLSDFGNDFLKVVMYYALIILTIKYTIIYMKRFIYIAFLTMIGPIIGLTYPLDKIKDGQAQAFSIWIKEFLFNVLIQPFHLIIYYIFVCGSMADTIFGGNPFYVLVVIAFLPQIEKMLKEMFGFNKGGSLGNLESAFGGAAVMNMMNKWGTKSSGGGGSAGSQGSNTGGDNTKVRTANDGINPYEAITKGHGPTTGGLPPMGEKTGDESAPSGSSPSGSSPSGSSPSGSSPSGSSPSGSSPNGSSPNGSSPNGSSPGGPLSGRKPSPSALPKNKKTGRIRNAFGKAKNKAVEIYNKPTIKGVRAVGGQVFTGAIRIAGEGTIRIAGAATLGTIGLAAGIASGEIENAFTGAIGGVMAGNRVGKNIANSVPSAVEKIGSTARDIRDTFEEGRYGESKEEREARQEKERKIKDFRKSSKYQQLLEEFSEDKEKEKIDKLVNAGITDPSKLRIAVESKYSTDNAIAYMHMAEVCPNNIFEDREKFVVYLESHGIPGDKADEIYNAVRKFK